ncbi:hypothetical protein DID88_000910 [Monilinia fructigena]|uniref:Uncharacterized protein n=1 Tax=Monilinia fructigena TaxID=38457 RepID=A0A395IYK5_9HELO|nr:hypothetical protein DID88_000910 [Monilinia fructigena]
MFSSPTITKNYKGEENSFEEQERKMEIQNEDHGIGGRVEEEFEIEKPRVRLPVVTDGIFNLVAITRLQDELQGAKKELLKLLPW